MKKNLIFIPFILIGFSSHAIANVSNFISLHPLVVSTQNQLNDKNSSHVYLSTDLKKNGFPSIESTQNRSDHLNDSSIGIHAILADQRTHLIGQFSHQGDPYSDRKQTSLSVMALQSLEQINKHGIKLGFIAHWSEQNHHYSSIDVESFKHASHHSMRAGPIMVYGKKLPNKMEFSVAVLGIHEFGTKNTPNDQAYQFSFRLKY